VDVILRKAYKMDKNKTVETAVPDSMADTLEEMHTVLSEAVAETSEELMEKFFSGEAFTEEEIFKGIKNGIKDAAIVPDSAAAALQAIGTDILLNTVVNLLPSPSDRPPRRYQCCR
jgi:elongation factor G